MIGIKDSAYEFYIGYPLTDIKQALNEITSTMIWIIPFVLILIFFGGIFLVNRFTKPLKDINTYIDKLLQQPLDQVIEKINIQTEDELGTLIKKINHVTEKMRESMVQSLSFSTLAAHELRSPLAIIRSQFETILQTDTSTEEIKETLTSVYDDLLRLNRIINDLLSLGTLHAGTFKLDFEVADIGFLLKEFYEKAMLLARPKNISVVLKGAGKINISVDVLRLRQVLFNLLDNSIKNTDENGRIRLHYYASGGRVNISFSDTGVGIPEPLIPKIFDAFQRGTSKDGTYHGTGLELALVKSIIEAHNGNITVESEVGQGTTFIISLPNLLEISNNH